MKRHEFLMVLASTPGRLRSRLRESSTLPDPNLSKSGIVFLYRELTGK
ncbi:hypothetical protein SC1_04332 [Sphingopyxis sp. C-1]|nr:hypothetical protein SC1_04332 [Sphingopyxis sp. C-1]